MDKKLNLAYDVINAFMQWFLYHHLDYGEDVRIKIEKFFDCEVKDEN